MPQAIGAAIIQAGYWAAGYGGASATAAEAAGLYTPAEIFATDTILGVTYADVVGTIAINAVNFAVQAAVSGVNPQTQKINVRAPVTARRSGYGIVGTAGTIRFE
jgi:hypothetical protein